ncbi:MAG TPA: peptidoglycan-binding protein [Solirubrobacteraceae bacterium]|nr:peptidoglycan-binding protein [Solirubrobacteraceae bacterium]
MAPATAVRGSPRVAALQVALRAEHLYSGDVDGRAGPQTGLAVRAFQRRARLAVDGVAGSATRRALGRRGRPAYAARVIALGARGWDVSELQFLMAWRGFPSGPMDGGFGPRTRAALLRYQAWAGLTPDGAAGSATLISLERPPARSPLTMVAPVQGCSATASGRAETGSTVASTSRRQREQPCTPRVPAASPSRAGAAAGTAG